MWYVGFSTQWRFESGSVSLHWVEDVSFHCFFVIIDNGREDMDVIQWQESDVRQEFRLLRGRRFSSISSSLATFTVILQSDLLLLNVRGCVPLN